MKSSVKIGRDNSNDIIINEPSVSRNHAVITKLEDDRYEVKDLGSTNGTFINGKLVIKEFLLPGDQLQVASSYVDWQEAFNRKSKAQSEPTLEDPFSRIRKTIQLGAANDNDLIVDGEFVSQHHARVSLLKDGTYYLEDLGSTNGSFVNGARVSSKNFSKTDNVKLATSDLPPNWFDQPGLRVNFIREHKRLVLFSTSLLVLVLGTFLVYQNRCRWFGKGCTLTAGKMYEANKNAMVYIDHAFYYTLTLNGTKYYVGKNKTFTEQTEANPDPANLLPYSQVSGTGCFINVNGAILTSALVTNPWLNESGHSAMIAEVISSRTLKGLTLKSNVAICGETALLKWIPYGVINNQQNYTEATTRVECQRTDSTPVIIQSVKKQLPPNTGYVMYAYSDKPGKYLYHSDLKYYGSYQIPSPNKMTTDTFYSASDTTNINTVHSLGVPNSLPALANGSPVFNTRGELIGLVHHEKIILLTTFIKQLNN